MTDKRERVRLVTEVIGKGVELLAHAYEYALDAEVDASEFAVEIETLRHLGMRECDFRWLLAKEYVHHLEETTLAGDETRAFRRRGRARFSARSCFVLTHTGILFFESLDLQVDSSGHTSARQSAPFAAVYNEEVLPLWDAERQILFFANQIVKQFKLPSPNQIAVLAAFEEEGWPPRVDDPLLPKAEIDPKRRLQDTIKGLNRSQRIQLIRFQGDGSGEGVLWEPLEEALRNLHSPARSVLPRAVPESRRDGSSYGGR